MYQIFICVGSEVRADYTIFSKEDTKNNSASKHLIQARHQFFGVFNSFQIKLKQA